MMYFDLHPDNKQVIEASLKHSGGTLFCSVAQKASSSLYLAFLRPELLNREHNTPAGGWGGPEGRASSIHVLGSSTQLSQTLQVLHPLKKSILTPYNYF